MSEVGNVSDALATDLANEFPAAKRSKRPLVLAALVALVVLFFGVRRLRAKRRSPLGGGINDISV